MEYCLEIVELDVLFKQTIQRLSQEDCEFALCGGVLATIYREQPRYTGDIDFILSAGERSQKLAATIIEDVGLKPHLLRSKQLSPGRAMNKKSSPVAIVVGRDSSDRFSAGLDFLLPTLPWVQNALERAQYHRLEFGFGPIPCIPLEDLIIAKAYAVHGGHTRFKDLDDLSSIFNAKRKLDLNYLVAEFDRLQIVLPRELEKEAPKALAIACKRIRNQ